MPQNRFLRFIASHSALERFYFFSAMFAMVNAVSAFGEVISRKSLQASPLQVTLLTMLAQVLGLSSIWAGRFLSGRDQRKTIWRTGMFVVIVLLSGFWLQTYWHLFVIFLAIATVSPFQTLAQSRILQQYAPSNRRGKIFGISQGIGMLVGAIFSALAGWWLDHHDQGWQTLYLTISVAAFAGVIALSSIATHHAPDKVYHFSKATFFDPWKEVVTLLKRRKDFLRFESAFMLYGIAFMMQLPIIPLYLVDDLHLQYSDIGIARGTVHQLVMIAGIPLFGRLFDRSTPHRLSAQVFALGALFPMTLLSAWFLTGVWQSAAVMVAFALFGVIMSGVSTLWNLSAMRFAGRQEDVSVYQSVHIAATGVRGAFAPLFGLLLTTLFGNRIALACATFFWLSASVAMVIMRRIDRRAGEAVSLRAHIE